MTEKDLLVMYLGRYQRALTKITELEQLKHKIESEAISLKGVDTTSVNVKSSRHYDKVSTPVVSVISLDQRIAEINQKLPAISANITNVIDMLPVEFSGGLLLKVHFIFGYQLSKSGPIIGVSRSQVYVLYHNALDYLLTKSVVIKLLEDYKQLLKSNHKQKES